MILLWITNFLNIRKQRVVVLVDGSFFNYRDDVESSVPQGTVLGSGSGLYSGGLTWSIVLRCDDHTGIFTCDGCARDPYFYVPAETQSYVIKLSCSRKVLAASGD